ncbi:dTDP-4-dehydrorhamnose 3,5-epimerase [Cellulophaga sp. HaHa_2_95]|uniref:dTDP-4-dehydrorhamnose 3,5-epimerase n=1 Tax=unclassified Cellulophaga TaxID=2634405 RepID=UPI00051D9518|nr:MULTISPECIES: dTDP-4-dehydrorhamnose 3,5-epimerase [unclassified Cellulophaga]KGK30408.1 dTDP-4-dehydrorhamnose 3,5-epimerase [Cellulophaga sp. E6(2014)]QXP51182.1 dTDP-4-dehydrorhamnose 3,5-epimerase [Cellulophaga sp. HaHa_2_1]QXP56489.1 dTDP-4-dehydrorhamnose 3,5-epimerase [Cellulophaga sp. HaHa_2_95]
MIVKETYLKGCFVIEPKVFEDDRGYFFESFNENTFEELIGKVHFVQDNQSFSSKGVVRAIHYQIGDHSQAKLVRVLKGVVLDVAVDLRKNSPTFGKHFSIELSEDNKKQLFIPRGFGHGFSVLSETAEFFYKCDNFYNKESEGGIIYNDKSLNIDWKVNHDDLNVSTKDLELPTLQNAKI